MRRAFTLIEMVVVIGIIVLLAALTVAVSSTLTRKAEERQAEDTLRLLDMALQEWETAADRQITYGDPSIVLPTGQTPAYDINETLFSPTDPVQQELLTSRVLAILANNSAANEVLAKIDTDYLMRVPEGSSTRMKVVDPWDKSYRVVFPGRLSLPGDQYTDDDGTVRTLSEQLHGICQNRTIAFISGGPDGDFGDRDLDRDLSSSQPSPTPEAADNMSSKVLKTQ
jgi:prepilin-type N-terminal cleavage/methylation domain-containing protein